MSPFVARIRRWLEIAPEPEKPANITVQDGETQYDLSPAAVIMATLFLSKPEHAQVIVETAIKVQRTMDEQAAQGKRLSLNQNRIVRPGQNGSGGMVTA